MGVTAVVAVGVMVLVGPVTAETVDNGGSVKIAAGVANGRSLAASACSASSVAAN